MLDIIGCFEEEIDFRGFECGLLSICDTFWVQTTLDYLSIESENARGGVLGLVTPFGFKQQLLSVKKVEGREGLEHL